MNKYAKHLVSLVFLGLMTLPAQAGGAARISTKATGQDLQRPGTVTCYQTSMRENQAAAQATNATRRARGLPALKPNADLAAAAARHACDMARRGVMSHRGSNTRGPMQRLKKAGYRPSIAAENIAAGPFTQERVLREWVRSSGHLANILIPQVRHYGIGKAVGADGRTVYWAAVYSAPR
ncbi:CAP domain-containing protein [Paracoccus binzhouensis]|uniref:CAP domain-containing protein n=1 Tax=Paracoccus binzhouensis TaxID=2796149 RepID=UPI001E32BD73|nr:CAP domain-containing protein [Paracoccus binzhouensis]